MTNENEFPPSVAELRDTSKPWRARPNPRLVPPELRPAVRRSAVLNFLISDCLALHVGTLRDLEQVRGLEQADAERLGIVSPPTHTGNVIASGACAKRYGDLGDIPCFYRVGNSWWLDVDERLARRGLLIPVRDLRRPNLIVGLKCFRHVRDEKPFFLRVRAERVVAA